MARKKSRCVNLQLYPGLNLEENVAKLSLKQLSIIPGLCKMFYVSLSKICISFLAIKKNDINLKFSSALSLSLGLQVVNVPRAQT